MGQRKSLIEYEHGKCAAGLAGIHPICKMEFCSNHCLVALDLVANVEQPFYSHRPERQAMQSVGRSIDWTLEDMVDGVCSSAPHSQAAEEAIPPLYKQEQKRSTPVRRR